MSLVMMLCHRNFSLEFSSWSYGDTTVAGAAYLHGCAALTSEHWCLLSKLSPKGKCPNFSLNLPSSNGESDASGRAAIQGTSTGSVYERIVCEQLR